MRELFPGYYRPSSEVLHHLWNNGLFVLDTSVLLDIYRYSESTVDQLLTILDMLSERLWLPYQAALEYHRNVESVIAEQQRPYDVAAKKLREVLDAVTSVRGHPFLDPDLLESARELFSTIDSALIRRRDALSGMMSDNPLKDRVAHLFVGRVGEPFTAQELEAIYSEGKSRFEMGVPPGYADAKDKPEPQRYGDLVIWKEILRKLAQVDRPIVFVTSDVKEDWFYRVAGKTLGPRPELVAELTSVRPISFHMYTTPSFLHSANEFLRAGIETAAIDEVNAVLRSGLEIPKITGTGFDWRESGRYGRNFGSAPGRVFIRAIARNGGQEVSRTDDVEIPRDAIVTWTDQLIVFSVPMTRIQAISEFYQTHVTEYQLTGSEPSHWLEYEYRVETQAGVAASN